MLVAVFILTLASSTVAISADATLEATLQQVRRYDYDQSRQPLIDLESQIRNLPAADAEKHLVEFLRSDASIASKDFICRQLSLIGSEASVPVLESMLSSPETVEMARYALERIPGHTSVAALRNALAKASQRTRPGIVNTLGIRRDAQAATALSALAESQDKVLAGAAMSALGRIATPPALAMLAALRKKGVAAAMEPSLEAAGYLAAGQTGRETALALYRELSTSTQAMIRIGALQGLSAALGREAAPQLVAAMKEPDKRLQAAAIRFLNSIPDAEVTTAMLRALPEVGAAVRVHLVTALAVRGDRAAVPAIVKAAKDADAGVRVAAFAGLGMIGDAGSVGMLAESAASETATQEERAAARSSLDRMRGAAVDKAIVAAIGPAPAKVKVELIRSAGERAIAASSDALLAAVRESDAAVKREAFRALRETAGAGHVSALLSLLTSSTNESDRRESERALSAALRRSSASYSAEVLTAYRAASNSGVKASLLQVMGQSGAREALPLLRATLENSDADLVRGAILALTEWPDEQPLADLLAFAGRTQTATHQVLALRAVLKLMELPAQRAPAESVKILESVMNQARQPDEKKTVLALLPRYPTKEALQIAESAESDPNVASEAKAAMQRLRRLVPSR